MFTTGAGVAVLMAAVLGLIVGIAVVAQTIYATTMDHIREYGTLKAMGAPNRYVLGVIMQQAAIAAVMGYAIGMVGQHFCFPRGGSMGGAGDCAQLADCGDDVLSRPLGMCTQRGNCLSERN